MKKTARIPLISSLAVGLLGAPALSEAVEFGIQPRVETGFTYYKFKQERGAGTAISNVNGVPVAAANAAQGAVKLEDTMPFLGAGLTFFADRFFIDLNGQKAFNGEDDGNQQISTFSTFNGNTSSTVQDIKRDTDFDRTEYAISAGYSITDRLAAYAGYKWAYTNSEADFVDTILNNNAVIFEDGSAVFVNRVSRLTGDLDVEVAENGPFIGITYGWEIKQGFFDGVLSANFAVAHLDSRIRQKLSNQVSTLTSASINGIPVPVAGTPESLPDNRVGNIDGTTTGFTVGIGWRGFTPVKGLTYSLGIQGYTYDFDSHDALGEYEETAVTYKVGVAYTF